VGVHHSTKEGIMEDWSNGVMVICYLAFVIDLAFELWQLAFGFGISNFRHFSAS
jgi:hypothetical protein